MEIIAETKEGFLLTASKREVALLRGYESPYSDGYRGPDIGFVIELDDIVKRVAYLRNLDIKTLAEVQSRIESITEQLQLAKDAAQKLNLFEVIKE
jgi:hypothetical protein